MKEPKILLYDIETMANLGWIWGKYEQNVIAYEKEMEILCFAYKWIGQKEIHCITKQGKKNDKSVVGALHALLERADVIIAHNGNQFDLKKARTRFAFYNMPPTKFISTIDTKLIAKRYFSFNSNSLDDLGEFLGLGRKVKHQGFDLWLGCMSDDSACWKTMIKYNKMDVRLLEKIYTRFRPYIQNHPNLAILGGNGGKCPNCGSSLVHKKGIRINSKTKQQQWQCQDCASWYLTAYRKT